MRKAIFLLVIITFLLFCETKAFSIDMTLSSWKKGTYPLGRYVNIAQITTTYGDGVSVNTLGYPGAFAYNYQFFGYCDETFIVPPSGMVEVEGYFMYDDITPHHDRKQLSLYVLSPDMSGFITNITRILDYNHGSMPGVWYYRRVVFMDLEPEKEFILAFGRSDLCDTDRELQACWTNINVTSCRTLKVPQQFSTIQQAILEASPGDKIRVVSGIYDEQIFVDKDNVKIIGEGSETTIIDARTVIGSEQAAVNITGSNVLLSGFTIMGSPESIGIVIQEENVIIRECEVTGSNTGVHLFADNAEIIRCIICNSSEGVWIQNDVVDCLFYHNNFFNNTRNVGFDQYYYGSNSWDCGYAGNFWSNYSGADTDGNGIGDDPHIIGLNNVDYRPLMNPYVSGDVNYDGMIDMRDVGFVARRFGCIETDPLWSPHADFNEDGMIDMRDIGITARKFGQIW